MTDQLIKACNPIHAGLLQQVGEGLQRAAGIEYRSPATIASGCARDDFPSDELVVEVPTGQAFDQVEAVTQDQLLLVDEDRNTQIRIGAVRIALVDRPIEASHAIAALDARPLEHDVVTGLAIIVSVVALTIEYVVTDNRTVEEQL
ncbi:hypothetical protein D9M68_694150 [compost metagenome]